MVEADPALQEQLFANFQYEIYGLGQAGERPRLAISPLELEQRAREAMSEEAFGYVAGGAGAERTLRANLAAFERVQIVRGCYATSPGAISARASWARRCRRR